MIETQFLQMFPDFFSLGLEHVPLVAGFNWKDIVGGLLGSLTGGRGGSAPGKQVDKARARILNSKLVPLYEKLGYYDADKTMARHKELTTPTPVELYGEEMPSDFQQRVSPDYYDAAKRHFRGMDFTRR